MKPTELILKKFEQISSIPRGTKFEAGIRQWPERNLKRESVSG